MNKNLKNVVSPGTVYGVRTSLIVQYIKNISGGPHSEAVSADDYRVQI
jgi:hypothetical protein